MPRPSDNRVRVRHTSGVEKLVDPKRLKDLSPRWSRVVPERPRRRPAKPAGEPITPTPPAVEPDTDSQEG